MTTFRFLLLGWLAQLLVGCAAPAYVAGQRKALAVSSGVAHAEGRFAGSAGVDLFEQSWRPTEPPKAAVILVHGLKDHSDRYAAVAEKLTSHRYAVYAFDLRGHGDSAGDRVWVDSFDEYLADLDVFLQRVREREPGRPIFLFGHSMGGAIVTLYTLTRQPELGGLVLSGAALKPGSNVSGFLIGVTQVLGSVLPRLGVLELDDSQFSRDPAVVASMKADPLVYDGKGPARTAKELLKALVRIQEQWGGLRAPVLILHGAADTITNPEGSKELNLYARSTDKTLKLYDGLYHDLLHEPEKDQVVNDMLQWLDARAEQPSAPAAPSASVH